MLDDDNHVPEGAKGTERGRKKDDPVKKYLPTRRPRPDDHERWVCYRTEALLAYNEAWDDAAKLLDLLGAEYDAAMAHLKEHRPSVWREFATEEELAAEDSGACRVSEKERSGG